MLSGTGKRAPLAKPDLCSVQKRVQSLRRDGLYQEILLFVSMTRQNSRARINSCWLATQTTNIAKGTKKKPFLSPGMERNPSKSSQTVTSITLENYFYIIQYL